MTTRSRWAPSRCKFFFSYLLLGVTLLFTSPMARAIQVDWSGQFWGESHWLYNYQLDQGRLGADADPIYYNAGGPYVPGVGEKSIMWHAAFFRLKPKVIVNDSIHLHSEWHIGSPVYGFLGRGLPQEGADKYNLLGSQRAGMAITAARFWASLITDFGTIEFGRAPLHWGLGAVWNSGDGMFERFQSSGDMVRLVSKFGNFTFSPMLSLVSMGKNAGGALETSTTYPAMLTPRSGHDDVVDYHLLAKYENTEEDFDFGLMWTRRVGSSSQDLLLASSQGTGLTKMNFNVFDFFIRKKLRRFTLGAEVPVIAGKVGGIDGSSNEFSYSTFAAIAEATYSSDQWDISVKGGHVPGQPDTGASTSATTQIDAGTGFKPIYLHRNYGLGLIMFHYNLYGLGGNNPDVISSSDLRNPYDNPITNANYISIQPTLKLDKWSFFNTWVAAWADQTVPKKTDPSVKRKFYNHQRRRFYDIADMAGSQRAFMGWETDLGVRFKWDDHLTLTWTTGFFFPGAYYDFANRSWPNDGLNVHGFMFASQLQAGIQF